MYFNVSPKSKQVKDWNDLLIKREGKSYSDFEKSKPVSKKDMSSILERQRTKLQEYEME